MGWRGGKEKTEKRLIERRGGKEGGGDMLRRRES
jgi:hypothetical protein